MSKASPIITNFSAGEWSARMEGRVELEKYYSSCRTLKNMLVVSQGGADFRPGTKYIITGKTDANKIRLIPFSIKNVGEYILELGNLYIRVIKCSTHAQLETAPGVPLVTDVATPWGTADLFEIKYAQTKDAMYFTHPSYSARKLVRTDDTTDWTLSAPTFSGWLKSTEKDITAITQADPASITATAHGLATNDVVYITDVVGMIELNCNIYKITKVNNDTFTLNSTISTNYTAYVSGGHVVKAGNLFSGANNYPAAIAFYQQRMILAGTNTYPDNIWLSKVGDLLDYKMPEGLKFQVWHTRGLGLRWLAGKSEIAFGADSCEGVVSGAPISDTNYQLRVESGYGVENVQGQLVNERILFIQDGGKRIREFAYHEEAAGWLSPDLTLFADHITGDGIVETAVQRSPDTLLWCVRSDGVLAALTYEYRYGVAGWSRVVMAESGVVESIAIVRGTAEDEIYVSVKRTVNSVTKRFIEYFAARDFGSDQADAYFVDCGITDDNGDAVDITGATQAHPVVITSDVAHGFLDGDTVKLWDSEGSTELNNIVWEVANKTADTFELKETDDFAAWDNTVTYPVGFIVDRTSKNYISIQEGLNKDPATETDYWALWPTAYTSGGYARKVVNSMSGLGHLEGESVAVLIDGATHANKTVSGSSITFDRYGSKNHAGLGYSPELKLMRIEAGGSYGTAQGKKKRVHRLLMRVYKTLNCKVGPDADHLTTVQFRGGSDAMDAPPALFSGDKEIPFDGSWDRAGDIYVTSETPTPLNILAIMPELTTND